MNAYVAWLELKKRPAGSVLGSPNPVLAQELVENRMIISEFTAESDEEALARARRTVESWEPSGGWLERQVVKIWEVTREVPVG